jgi:hypothetical protein
VATSWLTTCAAGHLRYKLGVAEKKAKAGAIAAARS